MTKLWRQLSILLLLLTVSACSSSPAPQPYATEQGELILEQGVESHQQGRYSEAVFLFNEAANHFRSIDNQAKLLIALLNLAETAEIIGQQDLAYKTAHTAKDLAEQNNLAGQYFRAKLLLARIQLERGNIEHARKYTDELLAQAPTDEVALRLSALILRAEIALNTEPRDLQWLQRLRQQNPANPLYKAKILRVEAAYLQVTDLAATQEKQEQALRIYQQAAYRPGTANALAELAQTYTLQSAFTHAEDSVRRALYIRAWLNDNRRAGELLMQLANIQEQQGNLPGAQHTRAVMAQLESQPAMIRNSGVLNLLDK